MELMRLNEKGCDPNHKRLTPLVEIEKTLRCVDPQTTAYGSRATIGEQESGTNPGGQAFVAMMVWLVELAAEDTDELMPRIFSFMPK
jgi:hypothetical protein